MPFARLIDADDVQEAGEHMRLYTHPFITPITMDLDEDHIEGRGKVLGSATFLELRGKPYILTNEHVARVRQYSRLRYFRDGGEEASPIVHPFQAEDDPVDAALARIDEADFAILARSPAFRRR